MPSRLDVSGHLRCCNKFYEQNKKHFHRSWNSRQTKMSLETHGHQASRDVSKNWRLTPTHLPTWTENTVPRANLFSNGKFVGTVFVQQFTVKSVGKHPMTQFHLLCNLWATHVTETKRSVPPNQPEGSNSKKKRARWIKAPSWARKSHHPFCWIDNMWHLKRKSYVCLFSPLIETCCQNC